MRLILYVRVSTLDQARDGVSLDEQESRLRAWCAAMGHDSVYVAREEGVSGSVAPAERLHLGACLKHLSSHAADGIAVVALDRLSRSTRDILELVDRSQKEGWAIVSLRDSLDTSSAVGRFVVTILAGLAQMERELTGERTAAALAHLKKQGKRFSRNAPWGFRHDGDDICPCAVEEACADVVRRNDGCPDYATAAVLQLTYGQHPRTGREWKAEDVRRVRRAIAKQGVKG